MVVTMRTLWTRKSDWLPKKALMHRHAASPSCMELSSTSHASISSQVVPPESSMIWLIGRHRYILFCWQERSKMYINLPAS